MQVSYTKYGIGIGSQSLRAKTKNTENHAPRVYTHTHRILLCWIPQWVSIGTARDCPWRQVCCLPTVQTVRSSRCSGCNATAAARRTSTRCSSRDTENQNGQSFPTFLRFFGGSSSWLFLSEKSFLMISPDFRGSSVLKSKLAKRQQVHWALRLDMAGPARLFFHLSLMYQFISHSSAW